MDFGIYLITQLVFMTIPSIESRNTTTCNAKKERKKICKSQTLEIKCENGTAIHIEYANYGRMDDTTSCSELLGTELFNCENSQKTIYILNLKCRSNPSCQTKVSEEIFGNPCLGITKFLIVEYKCLSLYCFHETTDQIQTEQSIFQETTTNTLTFSPTLSMNTYYYIGYIISGAVLGVSGFVFLAIIIIIVRKRFCNNKSFKQKSRTQDEIELREQLQHNSQYEDPNQYDDPTPHLSNTAANETIPLDGHGQPVTTLVDEGTYDVSSNKILSKPNEIESEYDTHLTVPDDTYDESVTSAQRKATSDDVNNTYDHFFQQQDENEYDLSSNPSKMINDNQNMYS